MKIAVVTDDGVSVAQHFGRARYYQVFTVDQGIVSSTELRDRTGTLHHHKSGHHDHDHNNHNQSHHGAGAAAEDRHAGMISQITDVDILLAGGMGQGARSALGEAGIRVVATDSPETIAAVTAYLDGTLQHREERFH
jgi:predicted Fe-Mo cluster-binding NifX family protein